MFESYPFKTNFGSKYDLYPKTNLGQKLFVQNIGGPEKLSQSKTNFKYKIELKFK